MKSLTRSGKMRPFGANHLLRAKIREASLFLLKSPWPTHSEMMTSTSLIPKGSSTSSTSARRTVTTWSSWLSTTICWAIFAMALFSMAITRAASASAASMESNPQPHPTCQHEGCSVEGFGGFPRRELLREGEERHKKNQRKYLKNHFAAKQVAVVQNCLRKYYGFEVMCKLSNPNTQARTEPTGMARESMVNHKKVLTACQPCILDSSFKSSSWTAKCPKGSLK